MCFDFEMLTFFRFHTGAPSPNNGFHATVKIGMFSSLCHNNFLITIIRQDNSLMLLMEKYEQDVCSLWP